MKKKCKKCNERKDIDHYIVPFDEIKNIYNPLLSFLCANIESIYCYDCRQKNK